jgi:DNA-binding IclR family transcriptional regulator
MVATLRDRILAELARHPNGVTADEIARAIGSPLKLVQQRVSKLQRQGLVGRLKQKRVVMRTLARHLIVYVPVKR